MGCAASSNKDHTKEALSCWGSGQFIGSFAASEGGASDEKNSRVSVALSPLAVGGRCLRGTSECGKIFKPVFPHRCEHCASQRYRQVLRARRELDKLCDLERSPPDGLPRHYPPVKLRMDVIAQWARSAAAQHVPPRGADGTDQEASRVFCAMRSPPQSDDPLRKLVSLADVDRGLRDAPFYLSMCTTNVSSICVRAFNYVKFLLGRDDAEREDERLDAVEFHMVLTFVLLYLEALVLLDDTSPLYEDPPYIPEEGDAERSITPELPLGCSAREAGEIRQPSPSATIRVSPFPVGHAFYHQSVLPLLVGDLEEEDVVGTPSSGAALTALRRSQCFPTVLRWKGKNDVPAAFRKDLTERTVELFGELERIRSLTDLVLNSPGASRRTSTNVTNFGSSGSHLLSSSKQQQQQQQQRGVPGREGCSVSSPELCEFLSRARLLSLFEDRIHPVHRH